MQAFVLPVFLVVLVFVGIGVWVTIHRCSLRQLCVIALISYIMAGAEIATLVIESWLRIFNLALFVSLIFGIGILLLGMLSFPTRDVFNRIGRKTFMLKGLIFLVLYVGTGLIMSPHIVLLTHGKFPLHKAAQTGDIEIVKMLVLKEDKIHSKIPYLFNTPLHWAALNGHTDIVELLLNGGANVNAEDGRSYTPLHYATLIGHTSVVKILLAHNANIHAATEGGGETPLYCAAGGCEYLSYTLEDIPSELAPQAQISINIQAKKDIVALLLAEGADPKTATTHSGETPLHAAVRSGNISITSLLLSSGVDVNIKALDNWTPLHYAARDGPVSLVQFLLEEGADVSITNENGETPLEVAMRSRDRPNKTKIIELLRQYRTEE